MNILRRRRRNRPQVWIATAALAVIMIGSAPAALATTLDETAREQGSCSMLEVDVTALPATKEGQPTVAVNPRNPRNLVFVSTIFPPAPGLEPVDGGCFLAYSNDRGETWTRVPWPLGDAAPKCGEPSVAFDAKGT